MLEFKPVVSQDYERYNKYRAFDKTDASEGVFATLYIWDAYYNLEVAENGEFLFFRFNVKNRKPSFFFPIGKGDIKKAVDELSDYCMARDEKLIFRLVGKENAELLEKIYPDRFELREARDSYDYVYLSEKMISLSGKKLHSKRNHLNYFLENYEYEYVKVDEPKLLSECAQKAYELVESRAEGGNPFELGAMKSYFENYFEFNQTGAAIKVDGNIVAMSFGEKINDDVALIQVELADDSYRGAYQAINKLFCENEWKDCKYINREEDMGIEGLKKAKMSYQPVLLVEKYYAEEK